MQNNEELFYSLKSTNNNIFFSSHKLPSSEELDDLLAVLTLPLPDQDELTSLIRKIASRTNSNINDNDLNQLALASSGLTETKVKQVAAKALSKRGKISKLDIKDILEEKKQVIARSEVLEFFEKATLIKVILEV